ncbi:hypothetical protein Pelo_12738 [Pelomyxa schiedti]|nr:hypothetical protein Pelo_12738 [Pelomyxa schiedti]
MVKVAGGFVSNSSSTSYFLMWTDTPQSDVLEKTKHCVATADVAEEMDGFPAESRAGYVPCRVHTPQKGNRRMHRREDSQPARPALEYVVCHECMIKCDAWIESVMPWVRTRRAKALSNSALPQQATPHVPVEATPTLPVLGKELLSLIFKYVITIWERRHSQAYYDCVNSTSFDIQILRLKQGLPEVELKPEHFLPIESRFPRSNEEVLAATKVLFSLSTVCKSWREASLEDSIWRDMLKESFVQDYLPGRSIYEPVNGVDRVSTCRELGIRFCRRMVAQQAIPLQKWAPKYFQMARPLSSTCKDTVLNFVKGCKTGTLITEGQCVIGGRNTSLEYWRTHATMLGRS